MVTAQRHSSPLQEAPVSIHVVTGEDIEKARIINMGELSQRVPNLVISEGAINTNIYMRGVGSGTNRSFEQSVGMYIDDIYMGRGHQYRSPFLDLQQVDVLRGPQGALFGKNTIAGALVVSTRKPDLNSDFGAEFTADYEPKYGGRSLTSVFSGALSDSWAMRLVNKTAKHDGYWINTYNNADEAVIDESTTRLSLLFQPSDDWRFDTKWERSSYESMGAQVQLRQIEEFADQLTTLLFLNAYKEDPQLDAKLNDTRSADNFDRPEYRNQTTENALVKVSYGGEGSLDQGVRVTYTLGYSGFDIDESQDADFMPVKLIGLDDEREFWQWSQELRLDHALSETVQLQWGLYWQDQNLDAHFQENLGLPDLGSVWDFVFLANGIDPVVYPPTPFTRNTAFEQDAVTQAVFAEINWQFSENWRLLLGGRYNREEKDYIRHSSQDEFLNPGVSASAAANLTAVVFDVNVLTPDYQGRRLEEDFLPSVKVWWDMNAATNAYAKIERGAKSGGFNSVADSKPEDQEFEDEQATSYEIGTKSLLFDDRVAFNAALFYTRISDLQMTILNGARFLVGNAAESVSQGLELDSRWRLDENWQLSAYAAYLDSYYKDFENGPCMAEDVVQGKMECDLSGKTTPFSPEWNAGLQLGYELGVTRNIDFIAGLAINYSDEYKVSAALDPINNQPRYIKYDGQLALRAQTWELALVGKNLTDEKLINYSLNTPLMLGGYAAYMAPPRTYTLRFKLSI